MTAARTWCTTRTMSKASGGYSSIPSHRHTIHVSAKYMDRYLDEFTFRQNHRARENAMFDLLIGAV